VAPEREWFERDYYATLGVGEGATDKEITRAYRRLAKRYHPDANPGNAEAEERFKEISAAYDVLSDPEKRKEYDEVRRLVASGAFRPGAGGFGPSGFGPGFEGGTFTFDEGIDLGDLLGGLFGGRAPGGRRRGGARRGADLETEVHLDFLDALSGVTTTVSFTADAPCETCGGSGAAPGHPPERCPRCGGRGAIAVDQGPFSFTEVCPRCGGRGSIVREPCSRCSGRGVELRRRDVKVRIPPGVADGQRIRVKGKGAAGIGGGPPGDLYVVVRVRPHPVFTRRGRDLHVKVPVTFAEAALGANVRVPTPDGPVTVRLRPGTQSGSTQRIRGRGVHSAKGEPGDLLVTFEVAVPDHLDERQRKAVEELAAALDGNPRAHLGV
jgi:molecular chaperone DnaJ